MTTAEKTRSLRVLIVEDDTDVRMLLGSHLERLQCTVQSVSTGEECLAVAAADHPDVVIVDIVLPGMDGRAVIERLRADAGTAGCRVIVTSMLEPDDLRDLEVDGMLPKPFSRRDVSRVMTLLRRAMDEA